MTPMTQATRNSTSRLSQPRLFSHLNGLALLIGSIVAYGIVSGDWLAFILLLLVQDISFVGYKVNSTVGAWIYNIAHSYLLPIGVMILGYVLGMDSVIALGLIFMAHIGMDHMVGYGYKYAGAAFSDTHYNRI